MLIRPVLYTDAKAIEVTESHATLVQPRPILLEANCGPMEVKNAGTLPEIRELDNLRWGNRQSLAVSERGQLSQAILQFRLERVLHE